MKRRLFVLLLVVWLLVMACVVAPPCPPPIGQSTPNWGGVCPLFPPGGSQLTATYGAEVFHAQLTAMEGEP